MQLRMRAVLSENTSSTVFVASPADADDARWALKAVSRVAINSDECFGQRLLRERCAHEQLSQQTHPNIVKYFGCYCDAHHFCLAMEYVDGGDLFTKLESTGPMSEASVKRPAAEICAALGHLHLLDFIHLDLKPDNVVITTQGQHKLADFGSCVRLRRPVEGDGPPPPVHLGDLVGTPEFMAPEVVLKQPVWTSADLWSYGCLLFEMLTGVSPFFDDQDTGILPLLRRICRGTFMFPFEFHLSDAICDLIRSLLTRNPSLRLGAHPHGKSAVAGHAWFAGVPAAGALQEAGGNTQENSEAHDLPDLSYALVDAEMPAGQEVTASLLALSQPFTMVPTQAFALAC